MAHINIKIFYSSNQETIKINDGPDKLEVPYTRRNDTDEMLHNQVPVLVLLQHSAYCILTALWLVDASFAIATTDTLS